LLKKLGGDRVGLIVFAGKPVLKVPLTTDAGFFDLVLDEVSPKSAPRGGTLIGDAIRKGLDALPARGDHDQMLVLLTDGEDQESYPLDAAKKAAERGVKIFTVGLGDSTEGARIPIRDANGELSYVKEEGKEHWSKTDQTVLQEIAKVTGGAHVSAGTRVYDLGQIYEDRIASLTRGEGDQEVNRRRLNDQYQIFLALALVSLSIAYVLPDYSAAARRSAARLWTVLLAVCVFGVSSLGAAPVQAGGAGKVDEGIAAFRSGDYKKASEAFGEAAKAMPEEPRIAFDRGCAFAAQNEHDKAIEQFEIAAASQNRPLAATAHYNLGCLNISKAKAKLGQKPEEAKPEVRRESLEAMDQAVAHFRDCLAVDPEHADARYNIEAIRLWKKHIEKVWRDADAKKRRQEMNLAQYLQWLEKEQRDLRAKNPSLAAEKPSPRRREAIRDLEDGQRDLADEIAPLKEKIKDALTKPQASAGAANQPAPAAQPQGPEVERALSLFNNLADEGRTAMNAAADTLAAQKLSDASKPQADAVEKIDSINMVVSPFVELVKKGIATQEGLIAQSKTATGETPKDQNGNGSKSGKDANSGNQEPNWADAAWDQHFISNYGRVLAAKAKKELEQLEKTPVTPAIPKTPALPKEDKAKDDQKDVKEPKPKDSQQDAQAKAEQQRKELKRALQAGIDLSPKVVEKSNAAVGHLEASKPTAALPLQEETLKLLKEMLPKDEQKNDQKQNNQDKQNQDKKDQDKKDQNKKDQKDKNKQDQKDQKDKKDKKEQDKKDQKQQNSEKPKPADQEKKAEPQKPDPSKQQAEAAMRAVRQRQQDRKEKEKALLEKIYRPERVDKDW
jgi:hypothetical protein